MPIKRSIKRICAITAAAAIAACLLTGCGKDDAATINETPKNYTVTIPAGDGSQTYQGYPDGTIELIHDASEEV